MGQIIYRDPGWKRILHHLRVSNGWNYRGEEIKNAKKKKPSQVRRDRQRRAAFLERRHQEATGTPVTTTPCTEATDERTDEVKNEGVEEVAAKTNSTEVLEATVISDISASTENTAGSDEMKTEADEGGLSQEDIEILKKVIKESFEEGDRLTKEALESWNFRGKLDQHTQENNNDDDDNDNFENAKLWALRQKQSCNKSELLS